MRSFNQMQFGGPRLLCFSHEGVETPRENSFRSRTAQPHMITEKPSVYWGSYADRLVQGRIGFRRPWYMKYDVLFVDGSLFRSFGI